MLLKFIIPIILFVGSIGNSISIYAFTRPSVRGLSTFKFLAYLSLIDQLYLLVGLSHILVIAYVDYDFRNYSNFVCSVHSFLTLYLSHLSSNILAAVGVFRCVTLTTLRPLKPAARVVKASSTNATVGAATHVSLSLTNNNNRATVHNGTNGSTNSNNMIGPSNLKSQTKVIYSRNSQSEGCFFKRMTSNFDNADLVVAAIAFVIFLFDCHFLFLMRLDHFETSHGESSSGRNETTTTTTTTTSPDKEPNFICYPSPERSQIYYDFYTQVWPWIDQFIYSYIPFMIMIVSTIIIIHRLITINKQLKSKTTTAQTSPKLAPNNKAIVVAPVQKTCETEPMLQQSKTNSDARKNNASSGGGSSATQSPLVRISLADKLGRRKCDSLIGNETVGGGGGGSSRQSDVAKKRSKKNSQIYKLLLTLNIFFFVLVTPLVLSNSLGWLKEGNNVTTQIVYVFAYLNHTLNFVFYGFSCKMYRSIVYDLLKSFYGRIKSV